MTIVTRYPTALSGSDVSTLPLMTWASGLNPNRRWLSGRLPTSGAIASWASDDGSVFSSSTPTTNPLVGTEQGWRYAAFDGTANITRVGSPVALDATTCRTVLIIARPNTGDTFTGTQASAPITNCVNIQIIQDPATDVATITNGSGPLAAARDHWHMYAFSFPASGAGVFVIDGNSLAVTPTTRDVTAINLARSGSNYRQLRVLEVLTSADVFSGAQLITAYANAKAWYPQLTW